MIKCPDCQQPFTEESEMINHSLLVHEPTNYLDIRITTVSAIAWKEYRYGLIKQKVKHHAIQP